MGQVGTSPHLGFTLMHIGPETFVTTGEIAKASGLSRMTVLRDIAAGELKAFRRRTRLRYRIKKSDAAKYIARLNGTNVTK